MHLRVEDYVGRRRDSRSETDLVRRLRTLAPDAAFDFIWVYLDHDPVVGLELAKRALRRREDFERILRRGFQEADPSSIKFWLSECFDRVGPRRVLRMLQELALTDRDQARRAFYWTRIYLMEAAPELVGELDALGLRLPNE